MSSEKGQGKNKQMFVVKMYKTSCQYHYEIFGTLYRKVIGNHFLSYPFRATGSLGCKIISFEKCTLFLGFFVEAGDVEKGTCF